MMRFIVALIFTLLLCVSADAAARFGVCTTTCTWDGSSTAMWSTTSGGATGASVPTTTDDVTFDAATCVGGTTCTITVNTSPTVISFTMGACTASTTGCIVDFSVNNNNLTATGSSGISISGTGTRNLKMGNGIFTVSNSTGGSQFSMGVTTNLTFSAGGSTIALTGTGKQTFDIGNKTANIISISARTGGPAVGDASSATHTIGTLIIGAPNVYYTSTAAVTTNITNLTAVGTITNPILIRSGVDGTQTTISTSSALICTYCAFRDVGISGGGSLIATSSLNLGNNSGITFGGSGGCILGGWLLWRDMPEHINDNFPAWLEKAA